MLLGQRLHFLVGLGLDLLAEPGRLAVLHLIELLELGQHLEKVDVVGRFPLVQRDGAFLLQLLH